MEFSFKIEMSHYLVSVYRKKIILILIIKLMEFSFKIEMLHFIVVISQRRDGSLQQHSTSLPTLQTPQPTLTPSKLSSLPSLQPSKRTQNHSSCFRKHNQTVSDIGGGGNQIQISTLGSWLLPCKAQKLASSSSSSLNFRLN